MSRAGSDNDETDDPSDPSDPNSKKRKWNRNYEKQRQPKAKWFVDYGFLGYLESVGLFCHPCSIEQNKFYLIANKAHAIARHADCVKHKTMAERHPGRELFAGPVSLATLEDVKQRGHHRLANRKEGLLRLVYYLLQAGRPINE